MALNESIYMVAIILCLCVLVSLEVRAMLPSLRESAIIEQYARKKRSFDIITNDNGESVASQPLSSPIQIKERTVPLRCRFSVIIVTFNEPLLNKTYLPFSALTHSVQNVLDNTRPEYLYEVGSTSRLVNCRS